MTIYKNRINIILFFQHLGAIHPIIEIVQCKTASAARNLINFLPQYEATIFAFFFVFILLLWDPSKGFPREDVGAGVLQNRKERSRLLSSSQIARFCRETLVFTFLIFFPQFSTTYDSVVLSNDPSVF